MPVPRIPMPVPHTAMPVPDIAQQHTLCQYCAPLGHTLCQYRTSLCQYRTSLCMCYASTAHRIQPYAMPVPHIPMHMLCQYHTPHTAIRYASTARPFALTRQPRLPLL
eukprot:441419-Rhodomonas_salina.1